MRLGNVLSSYYIGMGDYTTFMLSPSADTAGSPRPLYKHGLFPYLPSGHRQKSQPRTGSSSQGMCGHRSYHLKHSQSEHHQPDRYHPGGSFPRISRTQDPWKLRTRFHPAPYKRRPASSQAQGSSRNR